MDHHDPASAIRANRRGVRLSGGLLVSMAITSLLPGIANAGIEEGDFRVSAGIAAITGAESKVEDMETDTTAINIANGTTLQVGKALSEEIEVGVQLGLSFVELEFDDDFGDDEFESTLLSIMPYLSANIPIGDSGSLYASPVLGLGYLGAFGDGLEIDAVLFEMGGEVKCFVTDDASVDVGLFFTYEKGQAEIGSADDLDYNAWTVGPRVKISIWP